MKILHIVDHSLPLQSGYAFRSHNIFREQRKRGWEPLAITSPKHEKSWKGPWSPQEQIEGFIYHRTIPVSDSSSQLLKECQLMLALAKKIMKVATQQGANILHAHSPILNAIPALWAGRRLKIPVVYEIRAFWEDAAVDHGTYAENSLKYRLVRALETWVCRQASQIGVLCKGLKNDLLERGILADKMTVIYNGVNPDDFSCNEPDGELVGAWKLAHKKVIGFIGSFYRYEGLDLLVQAFSRIAARKRDVVLLLVGGGEMEKELMQQVERLKLADHVVMPGRIPHARIPGVYHLIDALAYPRYSMRLTDLVTPLKPLEAMVMGKALIASDVGGHRELIRHGETGLLFPAGDLSALTDSLLRLLEDDALRLRLQTHAAKWVRKEHTWEKTTCVYHDIYHKALGRGKV